MTNDSGKARLPQSGNTNGKKTTQKLQRKDERLELKEVQLRGRWSETEDMKMR